MTKFLNKKDLGKCLPDKPKTKFTAYFNGKTVNISEQLSQPRMFKEVYHINTINEVDIFLAINNSGEYLVYAGKKGYEFNE